MKPEHDFTQLLNQVEDPKPAIACAAVHQLKVISEQDPTALDSLRKVLLQHALRTKELRVRWNLIIILGRLPLKGRDRAAFIDWLFERLSDASSLTRTFAMQALADLSIADPPLRRRVLPIVRQFNESGTAAMRARARKLLRQMEAGPRDV
jgi:hypothetical protein